MAQNHYVPSQSAEQTCSECALPLPLTEFKFDAKNKRYCRVCKRCFLAKSLKDCEREAAGLRLSISEIDRARTEREARRREHREREDRMKIT